MIIISSTPRLEATTQDVVPIDDLAPYMQIIKDNLATIQSPAAPCNHYESSELRRAEENLMVSSFVAIHGPNTAHSGQTRRLADPTSLPFQQWWNQVNHRKTNPY